MKICVQGLWHLGCVTAAGAAALGHHVVGLDFDETIVANLRAGGAPVFEPGLDDLIRRGLASGNLSFSSTLSCLEATDLLWITYDTPVDDGDQADAEWVLEQIGRSLIAVDAETAVLISSQLPVGSVGRLERQAARRGASRSPRIAYSPENLRMGRAVEDFLHPDRIVVGARSNFDKRLLRELMDPLTGSIEWMSVESAEMTKHAINAFFATSVAFANEIASICEAAGADALEVARGLRTESRIGARAYLAPGEAFAGGTLAREVAFLNRAAQASGVATPLLDAVLPSNDAHKLWAQSKLRTLFADLSRITVAIWGLTYKPDTDTLRRSPAAELCDWLLSQGSSIHVHDARVKALPPHWRATVRRFEQPLEAAHGADVLVIATPWTGYRSIAVHTLALGAAPLAVLDANRFLPALSALGGRVKYLAVGIP
jgi:UDPglucose 6-dehydrogenase